jgi:glucokinase
MQHDHPAVVLGDIGGTNARFACLSDGVLGPVEHLSAQRYPSFLDALSDFLKRQPVHLRPAAAVLAVAGVVDGERCALTNSPWVIDAAELRATFGFARAQLVNDFEAIAWSLLDLGPGDLYPLGGSRPGAAEAPIAVLGPGTGLGVAAVVPHPSGTIVLAGEGGHSTLAAASAREDLVIAHLRRQHEHVSIERVLSGPGLENLYRAVARIDRVSVPERSAAQITQAAIEGGCAISKAALDMFCAVLGDVAGNLALTFGARRGVFIAGGIVPRMTEYVASSQFRARFEAKGRLSFYVEPVPVDVILNTDAAFVGLRRLAQRPDALSAPRPLPHRSAAVWKPAPRITASRAADDG